MPSYFVDSNIIIDIAEQHPVWHAASASLLIKLLDRGDTLVINPVVFAEVSIGYATAEEFNEFLEDFSFIYEAIPLEAAFLAGKAFLTYRRAGGNKTSPLPDFFIGAHAAAKHYPLLTRDGKRYQSYFPQLHIITPQLYA